MKITITIITIFTGIFVPRGILACFCIRAKLFFIENLKIGPRTNTVKNEGLSGACWTRLMAIPLGYQSQVKLYSKSNSLTIREPCFITTHRTTFYLTNDKRTIFT